jgi:hypothetical protein
MKRWHYELKLLRRKLPFFAIGVEGREFVLILWAVELSVWKV